MKTAGHTDSQQAAHWMGVLVRLAPQELRSELDWQSASAAAQGNTWPHERLVDGVLALAYVAACAGLGWAGTLWL